MATTGVRELKNNLSHYLRRVARGERIVVTAHGHPVAELGPPTAGAELPAAAVRRPVEDGDPVEGWPLVSVKLPRGTVAKLLDEERGER